MSHPITNTFLTFTIMSFSLRLARPTLRAIARPGMTSTATRAAGMRFYSDDSLSYEEFTKKYEKEFDEAYDLYEVQRVLNNAFAYDLVPAPTVIERALKAARRVNDYATASRVFEALRYKVETRAQYEAYLAELKDVREELGITLHEELFEKSE